MTASTLTVVLAVWGAFVSSVLAGIKFWETFWRDRLRLSSTYSLSGQDGSPHVITIANLSSLPVQVSAAELWWVPNFLPLKRRIPVPVTPRYFYTTTFKIDGHSLHVFEIDGRDKFNWDFETTKGRKLYLYLHIFGRRNEKRLMVYAPGTWRAGRWERFRRGLSRFP